MIQNEKKVVIGYKSSVSESRMKCGLQQFLKNTIFEKLRLSNHYNSHTDIKITPLPRISRGTRSNNLHHS